MRLSTVLSVISATGALASNYGMGMADTPPSGYSDVWATQPVSHTALAAVVEPSPMVHETGASSVMMHDATLSPVMMHDTPTAIMHEITSTTMIHETASATMMHETISTMVHDITSAVSGYTASVSPPMAHEGPMTHTVVVGGTGGLIYTPNQVEAAVNDVVHFVFMSQNHTVTESTFAKPCNKKAADAPDSGFMANANNTVVPAPTWEYTVTSTDPTWWYCKQRTGTHCGKGMVFAINPTAEKSFDLFKMAAISINGTAAATGTTAAAVIATPVGTVTLVAGSSAAATGTAVATDEVVTGTAAPTALVTDSAAISSPAPIAVGWNEGGASCQCACFCGVSAYPQGDGVGAYGGYGGSLPAPW